MSVVTREKMVMDIIFSDTFLRTYYVREVLQEHWSQTIPESPEVELEPAEERRVDLGNFEGNTITGYKWHDEDGDGEWGDEENGLSGWTIYLSVRTEMKIR